MCSYRESDSNQVVLSDLRRATQYEVQVRARTMAGYGSFSPAASFRTLPDGKERPRLHSLRGACPYGLSISERPTKSSRFLLVLCVLGPPCSSSLLPRILQFVIYKVCYGVFLRFPCY